jgi:hypothetical protein
MYSPTYSELKTYLQKELDIEDETFITADELLSYFNEGVDMVEAAIHNIYEDYFLTSTTLFMVNGTQGYSLPTDIYAQKIRRILYSDGSAQRYEIKRVKRLEDLMYVESGDLYRYIIKNSSSSGLQLMIYPTPSSTNSFGTIWYIRNATKFADDDDTCDIPEFTSVIVQYVRWKCLNKEGHPDAAANGAILEQMKQEMVDTLTARIPDEDNYVQKDWSFYSDFDDWRNGGGVY